MTICERVFSLLASDGRDQKDLAMHIGVSTRTVSTWKTRGTNPGAEYIAGMLLERLPDDGTEFKWS